MNLKLNSILTVTLLLFANLKSSAQNPFILIKDSIVVTSVIDTIRKEGPSMKERTHQSLLNFDPKASLSNPEHKNIKFYRVLILPENGTTVKLESKWIKYETSSESIYIETSIDALDIEPGSYVAKYQLKTDDGTFDLLGKFAVGISVSNWSRKSNISTISEIPYRDAPTSLAVPFGGKGKNIHRSGFNQWLKDLLPSSKKRARKERCPQM